MTPDDILVAMRCGCMRCEDPGECGTLLGALLCHCGGPLLPATPLLPGSAHQCGACGASLSALQAADRLEQAEAAVRERKPGTPLPTQLEQVLERYSGILHPSNNILLSVKLRLGCLYGCHPFTSIKQSLTT